MPPVSCPPTPAVPAEGRQACAGAQGHPVGRTRTAARGREPVQCGGRGNDEATRLGARPGRAERRTAAERPSPPLPPGAPRPSPRGGAAHRPAPPRQTDPPAASKTAPGPGAAKQPRPSMQQGGMRGATPPAMKGGQGRGPQTTAPEEDGEGPQRDPPPPPPALPLIRPTGCRRRGTEALSLCPPPGPGGSPPSPRKGRGARGGNAAKAVHRAPPRPHLLAPTETAPGRRTRASTQGRHTDHTRDQHASTNQSSMEATPSMN